MNTQQGSVPINNSEESIDDGSLDSTEDVPCPHCDGEGIVYNQDEYDEENKDFIQCKNCNGTGIDPESLIEEEEDDYSDLET